MLEVARAMLSAGYGDEFVFSFPASGIILRTQRRASRRERQSHFWSFAMGGCFFYHFTYLRLKLSLYMSTCKF